MNKISIYNLINHDNYKSHINTKNKIYKCDLCYKEYKSYSARYYHINTIHKSKIYKCDLCYKEYKSYNSRYYHINKIHKNI